MKKTCVFLMALIASVTTAMADDVAVDRKNWYITAYANPDNANEGEPYDGRAEAAIDGKGESYFHSNWEGAVGQYNPQGFMIDMHDVEALTKVTFLPRQRENANGCGPTKYRVYVTNEIIVDLDTLQAQNKNYCLSVDNMGPATASGTWSYETGKELQTCTFQSAAIGRFIYFISDETYPKNEYLCCAEFNAYKEQYPSVTLNGMGYATYSNDYDCVITTEGVKAYTAKVEEDKIILNQIIGYIPAGTGILLYGGESMTGKPVEFAAPAEGDVPAEFDYLENNLIPTSQPIKYIIIIPDLNSGKESEVVEAVEAVEPVPVPEGSNNDPVVVPVPTIYALGNGNQFLKYTGYKMPNRAFLVKYEEEVLRPYSKLTMVFNDVATSISNAAVSTTTDNANCYNMVGQRISNNVKGIVIKNGKKYLNK